MYTNTPICRPFKKGLPRPVFEKTRCVQFDADSTAKGFKTWGSNSLPDVRPDLWATSLREVEAGFKQYQKLHPYSPLEPALFGVQRWPMPITASQLASV